MSLSPEARIWIRTICEKLDRSIAGKKQALKHTAYVDVSSSKLLAGVVLEEEELVGLGRNLLEAP